MDTEIVDETLFVFSGWNSPLSPHPYPRTCIRQKYLLANIHMGFLYSLFILVIDQTFSACLFPWYSASQSLTLRHTHMENNTFAA